MIADFDPRRRRDDIDIDMVRPTENSSWLVVMVLLIGVALAAWYVFAKPYTVALLQGPANSSVIETNHTQQPPPPGPAQ
ncbi:MAG TPA: hypothetical protein PKE16_18815 [Hyphomicrobium sp.]|nr:hypothetical protein [Hyphomicrobium sp.]